MARKTKTEQRMTVAGLEFVVRGVPAMREPDGRELLDGPTAERLWLVVANELAARGVTTGDAFRFMRKALGMRAVDLAALLDRTPEALSHWETGRTPVDRGAWAALAAMVAERADRPADTLAHLEAARAPRTDSPVVLRAAGW